MNASAAANATVVVEYRDSFTKALTKNFIVVVLGLTLHYINAGLIWTFCKHQIFYTNPRYILFFHLVVNDTIQVTLTVMQFIISYTVYKINVSLCCLLIVLMVVASENSPQTVACMAVECYIAICFPLRHAHICTVRRTLVLIGLIWLMSTLSILPDLFIVIATQPRHYFHSSLFCLRETVLLNPIIILKRDTTYTLYLVLVWLTILFTYFRILVTARSAGNTRKARNTIVLHGFQLVLYMAKYVGGPLKDALLHWFPRNYPDSLFSCYIIIQILPRSISPIIYGIKDKTFRKFLKRYLLCRGGPG